MSAEFRHIFFNDSELVQIVSGYYKHNQSTLPAGTVLDLSIVDGPEIMVTGRIVPDKGGADVAFQLEGKTLESAVIAHCIRDRIPLPQRGAKKSLKVLSNRLALIVTMNVNGTSLTDL